MTKQQGAALVIVMMLLASALVMAVMVMQTALVEERLAGNFRAAIQAQMRAETAAAEAWARWDDLDWHGAPVLETPHTARFDIYDAHPKASTSHRCPDRSCLYIPILYQREPWVLALGVTVGESGALVAHSKPLLLSREARADAGIEGAVVWQ